MNNDSVTDKVMAAIKDGKVHMRPRWHFTMLSSLLALGILIIALALIYAVGLCIFLLHQSGAWFAPSFGARGWVAFTLSIPWLLVALFVAFLIVLEMLARRYQIIYRRPLIVSGVGLAAIILLGGFFVEPLHHQLSRKPRGMLPAPLDGMYHPPFRLRDASVLRGVIVSTNTDRLLVATDDGTSTVVVSDETHVFPGADFEPGDTVIVMGDRSASGTIEAFGIKEIDGEND